MFTPNSLQRTNQTYT